jgi:hypothetical protein
MLLGINRDLHGKPTGMRTLGLVALGVAVAVLTLVPIGLALADPSHDTGLDRACNNPGAAADHNPHCQSDAAPDGGGDGGEDNAGNGGNGGGQATPTDADGDGIANTEDNCPARANPSQADRDHDGVGNACDPVVDGDHDGVVTGTQDNCPADFNPDQADTDHDGVGDACDGDLDGDGVANGVDNCPSDQNRQQIDGDRDGQGDACDSDANGNKIDDRAEPAVASAFDTTVGAIETVRRALNV